MSNNRIQQLAIRRILDTKDTELLTALSTKYFTGQDMILYRQIMKNYTAYNEVPSIEQLDASLTVVSAKYYLKEIILHPSNKADVPSGFIIDNIRDWYARQETIDFLDKFIDELPNLDKDELLDKLQTHILDVYKEIPMEGEVFDVGSLEVISSDPSFELYPSGLSATYDEVNGGFGLEELVMLGGRRGSGKSIIAANLALNRLLQNEGAVFFSIEMRFKEVYERIMSMLSGVPFSKFLLRSKDIHDNIKIAETRLKYFYEENEDTELILQNLRKDRDFTAFEEKVKKTQSLKRTRLRIVDCADLTIGKLDNYLNKFSSEFDIKMSVVDYLNIIASEDRLDWKTQITLADSLKYLSRKYKQTLVSPYQIDNTGEARFAKGILDSADRSFRFEPASQDEGADPNILHFETAKIRNGKHMKFDVPMDWECLRIKASEDKVVPGKILNMYGDGIDTKNNEGLRDI